MCVEVYIEEFASGRRIWIEGVLPGREGLADLGWGGGGGGFGFTFCRKV